MRSLKPLFDNNQAWARKQLEQDEQFFRRLAAQQRPDYLWIGCADSRVPANEILGLPPGEVFVHRNVANVVVHTDFNCLSVMQFAVDILQVKHIMVVGHYGCSGVHAALHNRRVGVVDNWLRHVRDVADRHAARLDPITDDVLRHDRLCELNVIEQVRHVCQSTVIADAWDRGQPLNIHGWVYGLSDGRLRDLGMTISGPDELSGTYQAAVESAFS